MFNKKEHNKKYQEDHTEYQRGYYKKNKESINRNRRKPRAIKRVKVLGMRIKEKEPKPISTWLKAKREENTKINNKYIKF